MKAAVVLDAAAFGDKTLLAHLEGDASQPGYKQVLEARGSNNADPLRSVELEAALSNCLSCKACTKECPSNVNLALLKAELMHARIRRHGLSLRERLFSSLANSSAIMLSRISSGSDRCDSRPLALNTPVTARKLYGSATSEYSASVGIATTLPRRIAPAARSSTSGWGSSGLISTRSVAMLYAEYAFRS